MKRSIITAAALLAVLVASATTADAKKKKKDEPQEAQTDQQQASPSPATTTNQEHLDLWNDPSFQKEVIGSYGFQAEIEPRVTVVEREQMEEVLPLLSSDSAKAIELLQKFREPEGASAVFDFTLGNLYFQNDELDKAAEYYALAIAKFPSYRRAHKNLGLIHVRKGDFPAALKSLSKVIQLGGEDALTYGLIGYSYSSTEQYLAAESAYRNALLLQPETLDWKLGLTQSVVRQQKYAEAITLCQELIGQYPDRADFWLLQANAYIGLGQPLKAAENFEILLRMGKATVNSLHTLGDIYVNEEMWDLATRAYGNAVKQDPEQDVKRPLRAVEVLAQRGALSNAKELIALLEQTYEGRLSEEDRKALLKLEARLAVAEGDGGDSVGVLEEIVQIDPLDGEALILLGQHYARINEPEQAIFYYERAESINGFEADAKVRHAQLLVNLTKYGEAIPLLKRAQEIEQRDDVARYLEQVERIARSQR